MRHWIGAIATYGIGDLATTFVGLSLNGIHEINPTGNALLAEAGFSGLIFAKVLAFVLIYAISYFTMDNQKVAPITLTVLGSAIVLWNTTMIISVL